MYEQLPREVKMLMWLWNNSLMPLSRRWFIEFSLHVQGSYFNPLVFLLNLWNISLCNCLIYCMLLFVNVNQFAVKKEVPTVRNSVFVISPLGYVLSQFALSWCEDQVQQQSLPWWMSACVFCFCFFDLRRDSTHKFACIS